jgi:hypothetical protein
MGEDLEKVEDTSKSPGRGLNRQTARAALQGQREGLGKAGMFRQSVLAGKRNLRELTSNGFNYIEKRHGGLQRKGSCVCVCTHTHTQGGLDTRKIR